MTEKPGGPVRVGVLDEDELVVAGLVAALAPHEKRVQVIALDSSAHMVPGRIDLLLYDSFDERHGLDAARLAEGWAAKLVVFSWSSDPRKMTLALANGAVGYVPKSWSVEEIVIALEQMRAGAIARPPLGVRVTAAPPSPQPHLTRRETEIVQLIATGRTNDQIAELLFLSINSIKTHIRSAYRKMGVTRRSQAVTWAFVNGVVPEARPEPRKV